MVVTTLCNLYKLYYLYIHFILLPSLLTFTSKKASTPSISPSNKEFILLCLLLTKLIYCLACSIFKTKKVSPRYRLQN